MAIQFRCQCGREISVDESLIGRRGKCPRCNTILIVPHSNGERASEAVAAAEAPLANDALVVFEMRREDGRNRPYQVMRRSAKSYLTFAPVVAGMMVVLGFLSGYFNTFAPLELKITLVIGFAVLGAIYFLIMRATSQAMYILFDIAANSKRILELLEAERQGR
jgi:hypothetical protein